MGNPEPIEALLSASLRVSRPVAACSRCRAAKIKCDGKLPVCSACERSGKADSCTSANAEFARGKERSYVTALESAAQRLEKKIDKARSATASGGSDSHSGKVTDPAISGTSPTTYKRIAGGSRKEALEVNELVSDFGFLTVNATSRDFHGFTSTMSFSKLLLAAAVKKPLPRSNNTSIPPRNLLQQTIEHYLDNFYVLLPFFSETELMSSISKAYQISSSPTTIPPIDQWYIRMISAISSATKSQRRGDENDKIALENVASAMELADYVIHPGSVVGIQALLLLVQYSLLDPEFFDCWYLIGMASRLVVDLGLHCEPSPEIKISKEALDLRRRIFYSTYALDRLISMSLDRSFSFTDDSASDVFLPSTQTHSPNEAANTIFSRSIRPSLFLFDIRRVQSSFYQTTRYSSRSPWSPSVAAGYIQSVSGDIEAWYETLPNSLQPQYKHFFDLERLYTRILVLSPSGKAPLSDMTERNQTLVFEYSVQFVAQLYQNVHGSPNSTFLTFADIQRAKYVGTQFLEVMWANFDRILAPQSVTLSSMSSLNNDFSENCTQALNCLERLLQIFEFANQRWNIGDISETFQRESAVLLGRLRSRQQNLNPSQLSRIQQEVGVSKTSDPSFGSQVTYHHQPEISGDLVSDTSNPSSRTVPHLQSIDERQNHQHESTSVNNNDTNTYPLPSGTLPRRTYEFIGGPK